MNCCGSLSGSSSYENLLEQDPVVSDEQLPLCPGLCTNASLHSDPTHSLVWEKLAGPVSTDL